ncbi:LexA family transcriptional regulator [Flammeovirga sp. EKP202]|uniref:LexA family protein n=1 Tax=Flammeovirga sp. EKP202 TaxID=2770592 RepID=UPI00165EF73A|nr:hypothetical protein [Flammeovirga sp. EKP202]
MKIVKEMGEIEELQFDREGEKFKEEYLEATGFPSPAKDFAESDISADDIIERGYNTFFCKMSRDIPEWRLATGDYLVVAKGEDLKSGDLFIAYINNDFRIFRMASDGYWSTPYSISKKEIKVWGKVTHSIVKLKR